MQEFSVFFFLTLMITEEYLCKHIRGGAPIRVMYGGGFSCHAANM